MVQEISPYKLNNQYDPAKQPAPECRALVFQKVGDFNPPYVHRTGDDFLPTVGEVEEICPGIEWRYAFCVAGEDYFLKVSDEVLPETEEFFFERITHLRLSGRGPRHQMFAMFTGRHLYTWYKSVRFCGACGARMEHSDRERAMCCPECGAVCYPRLMPAVIVAVVSGDKLLVTKYNRRNVTHYALVAGFTEIGETFEETVAREVMEEAGLAVTDISYYKSQPWGIAEDMLAGFFCRVTGDDTITMDTGELREARWVTREEIELQEDTLSLTNEMMTVFKRGEDPFHRK
ncbi:MAG: NAD(+) diphosphatase [Lachnospiraceae bacterium]|nr:NAD(+) diphosphatase [Lachnospiraceae bacterium]